MIAYYNGQYREICDIFYAAVYETASTLYSRIQIEAWAPEPRDYDQWRWRCELKRPFIFLLDRSISGFAELDTDGHIDCVYTHPNFNRRGVASALLGHIEEIAFRRKISRLYTEASHLAKGLFLKHGFTTVRKNEVVRKGVVLNNWIMEKTVSAAGAHRRGVAS